MKRKNEFTAFDGGEGVGRLPSPAQQYLESPLDLNELMVPHPTGTYFVRVDGDSMINAGIHHNDILVVDCTLDPANGSIVVARVNGEALVKLKVHTK
jgi:peptidase S24, S26A and S26B